MGFNQKCAEVVTVATVYLSVMATAQTKHLLRYISSLFVVFCFDEYNERIIGTLGRIMGKILRIAE